MHIYWVWDIPCLFQLQLNPTSWELVWRTCCLGHSILLTWERGLQRLEQRTGSRRTSWRRIQQSRWHGCLSAAPPVDPISYNLRLDWISQVQSPQDPPAQWALHQWRRTGTIRRLTIVYQNILAEAWENVQTNLIFDSMERCSMSHSHQWFCHWSTWCIQGPCKVAAYRSWQKLKTKQEKFRWIMRL